MSDVGAELQHQQLTDDLLWGTQAIADFIGRSLTETQYLVRIEALPIGRLGPKLLFASKQQLQRHLTQALKAPRPPKKAPLTGKPGTPDR
jgi:hypothetical protein